MSVARFDIGFKGVGVLALSLAGSLFACGGGSSTTSTTSMGEVSPDDASDELTLARECLDRLENYQLTDLETVTEDVLVSQMNEAHDMKTDCEVALRNQYRGPGAEVMATHLGRSFEQHALRTELALSERFDEMAGYCGILRDIIGSLSRDFEEITEYVESGQMDDEDARRLRSLAELTFQALQISILDFSESCR
ncbi:MAG: hypothetical protein KC561_04830 [Myxococcales bacterium]|nr:hypothetical protein [Myxococcales bacterium]